MNNSKKNFSDKTVVFLLGMPGSGKGTQAKMLSEHFNFYHFMTSRVGREYIDSHSSDFEAQKQADLYKNGYLWEPEWVLKIAKEKISEIVSNNSYKGIVFDGSPRTLFEAEGLYSFISDLIGSGNIKIFEIKVNLDGIQNRLLKRLVCSVNPAHIFTGSSDILKGNPCPHNDNGLILKRDLDDPEIFKTRVLEYQNKTVPGIEYLRKNHPIIFIDGNGSVEEVFKEIIKNIEN